MDGVADRRRKEKSQPALAPLRQHRRIKEAPHEPHDSPTIRRRFAPRIAQAVRSVVGPKVDVQLQAYGGPDRPTTLEISGPISARAGGARHPLNLT